MRVAFLAALSWFAISSNPVLADVVAPITAVVLYPGSATIIRTARVTPDMTQVVISGLPANFDTQALRVEGDPGIRVGQLAIKDVGRTEAVNPAEATLEAKLQTLRDQEAAVDAEIKAAEIVKAFLERLGGDGSSATEKHGTPVPLAGVIDAIGRGANDSLGRIQRATIQKREISKKIGAQERDLKRLRSGARDTRTVTVSLAAERAGKLRLYYQVSNAGWKPAYRAELDSNAATVALERLAMVSQKASEDWNGVKLILSTGQPRLSPQAREPQPWLLHYTPPAVQGAGMASMASPAPAARAAPVAMRARVAQASDESAEPPYVPPTFQTQSTFATEFELPSPVNLPADGREISLVLNKQTLAVKQRILIVPRIDKAGFVTAEMDRPEGVWPEGAMQLIRDGSYVGVSHWSPSASARFQLSFGRDDLLRVTVDKVAENSGTTGVFDKQTQRQIADVFGLTNMHKVPVGVIVLESSPVSTSDEIKVQATFDPKPTVEAWEQRRGVIAWEKNVAPGETAKFGVSYSIEYPKTGFVSGLR